MSRRRRRKHKQRPLPVHQPPVAAEPKAPEAPQEVVQGSPLTGKQRRALKTETLTIESYAGPVPPPALIRQFEEIYPGAAEIIFHEFQAQGQHRRSLETKVVDSNVRQSTVGQYLAFVLLFSMLFGAVFLLYFDKKIEGFVTLASGVLSALWALNAARKAKEISRDSKREPVRRKG